MIARAAGGLGVGGAPGLAMVTLSPEVAGAAEFTRWLAGKGGVPAMGHTQGKAACVEAFLEAGGAFAVHAFNRYGHPETPAHRGASPMDFVLNDARLSAGLIADGVHVAPRPLASFVRARGWERTVLTSDLVAEGGLRPQGDEEGTSGEMPGDALMREGVLSGSRLALSQMLPRLREWSGLDTAWRPGDGHAKPRARPWPGIRARPSRSGPARGFLCSRSRLSETARRDDRWKVGIGRAADCRRMKIRP